MEKRMRMDTCAARTEKYVMNPASGRMVLRGGRIGRKLTMPPATSGCEPADSGPAFPVRAPCLHSLGSSPGSPGSPGGACVPCAESAALVHCGMCGVVGPRDAMLRHARKAHAQPEPVYSVLEPNVCACGEQFLRTSDHNPSMHLQEHTRPNPEYAAWVESVHAAEQAHEQRVAELRRVLCQASCPHPPAGWSGGGFCGECMPRTAHGLRTCRKCGHASSNPYGHWVLGRGVVPTQDLLRPRRPPRPARHVRTWECQLCSAVMQTRHAAAAHVWDSHVTVRAKCAEPGCAVTPRQLVSGGLTYRQHCDMVHAFRRYRCVLGDACGLGAKCSAAKCHLTPLGLHNHVVAHGLPPGVAAYGVDISDLLDRVGHAPLGEIKVRVQVARERHEERCAVPPGDYRSGERMPNEMWLAVMARLDAQTLFAFTKVSKRMRALAHVATTPAERFKFNLRRLVVTDKPRMTATRAKAEYLLADADLAPLPVERVTNPHYRYAAMMRLYTVGDLEDAAVRKHGSWPAFQAEMAARAARALVSARQCSARHSQLSEALRAHRVELRSDSAMCESFINRGCGVNGESMAEVVDIAREMAFLHRHTGYAGIVERVKDEHRGMFGWYELDDVLEEAKARAVRAWYRAHPDADATGVPPRIAARMRGGVTS